MINATKRKINLITFEESQVQLNKTVFALSGLIFYLIINSASDTQRYKQPHHCIQSTVVNYYSRN